jgi:hypothetical protein
VDNLTMILASAATGGAVNELVPVYYGIGILALIISGLWALKRYTDHQRQENIQQGNREQQLSDMLDANTKAADKNTASIEKLGEKFDIFSAAIDKRLTLIDYRVDKLEENKPNGFRGAHDRPSA